MKQVRLKDGIPNDIIARWLPCGYFCFDSCLLGQVALEVGESSGFFSLAPLMTERSTELNLDLNHGAMSFQNH